MKLNKEQKSRMMEFVETFEINDIVNAAIEKPCDECPLIERCPYHDELEHETNPFNFVNSCDEIIANYITTGEIVDRRKEEGND